MGSLNLGSILIRLFKPLLGLLLWAWSNPPTFVAEEVIDENDMNQYVRDNTTFLYNARVPTGTIVDYGGSSAPSQWLLCDGSAVSRTTYADLFTVLGTTFGTGDGSTTFNLPDLRGRVGVGKDNMGGSGANRVTSGQAHGVDGTVLGAAGGVSEHQLTTAEMPSHSHAVPNNGTGSGTNYYANSSQIDVITLADVNSYSAGSDDAHTNMVPFVVVNKIIKI